MLYEPERHEPLHAEPWDAGRARAAIRAIAEDAATRFDAQNLWPVHPLDRMDMTTVSAYKCLYV